MKVGDILIPKKLRKFFLYGMICASLVLSTAACGKEEEEAKEATLLVTTKHPYTGSLSSKNEYIGKISSSDEVNVTPLVSGEVTAIHVKVGDSVKKGDLLFSIDNSAALTQYNTAKAAYDSATASANQATGSGVEAQGISASSGVSQAEYAKNSAYKQYNAALEKQTDLANSISELEIQVSDLESQVENTTNELLALQDSMPNTDSFLEDPTNLGTNLEELIAAQQRASALKEQLTALQSALVQAKSGLETARQSKKSLDSNISVLEESVKQADSAYQTALESYNLAVGAGANDTNAIAGAGIEQAKAALDSAQYNLDLYEVKAPISGVITQSSLKEHSLVASGNPALVVTGEEAMQLTFSVTNTDHKQLKIGDTVSVLYNRSEYEAAITEIADSVDMQTGLFKIKAVVATSKKSNLKSGLSVKVEIETDRIDDVTLIPIDSVFYENEEAYVFCVKDGKCVKTTVETGQSDDENIAVTGLSSSDVVITSWSSQLKDGVSIEIKEETNKEGDK